MRLLGCGACTFAIALALSFLHSEARATEGDIAVDERRSLLLAVNVHGAEASMVPISEIVRIAADALETRTSLKLITPEQSGMEGGEIGRCGMSPSCWLVGLDERAPGTPRYLLVVGVLTDAKKANLYSAILLDVWGAFSVMHVFAHGENKPQLDEQIVRESVLGRSDFSEVRDVGDARVFFQRLFDKDMRAALETREEQLKDNAILIRGTAPGLTIELDGTAVGVTRSESTRIAGVRAGRRAIALCNPTDREHCVRQSVIVTHGTTAEWMVERTEPKREERAHFLPFVGLGAAGAGAAIVGYALVSSPSERDFRLCVGAMPGQTGCKGKTSFRTLGPIRLAPLGYAIALSGLVAWLGDEIFGDDLPWWGILAIGVAAGAASYAVSVALD